MTNKNIWPFWFYLTYILQVWGANLQVFGSFFSNTSDLHGLGVGRSEEAISNFTDSCYKYLKMSSFFWEIKTNSTGLKLNRELGQFPLLISVSNLHCYDKFAGKQAWIQQNLIKLHWTTAQHKWTFSCERWC